jgi:hypothetical protein
MNITQAKEQVESLIDDRKSFIDPTDKDENNIFRKDIEAIKIVLSELDRKNKIIDKMARRIIKLDNSDQYCLGRKKRCPYNRPTLIKCKECVKYYYEKRNKR